MKKRKQYKHYKFIWFATAIFFVLSDLFTTIVGMANGLVEQNLLMYNPITAILGVFKMYLALVFMYFMADKSWIGLQLFKILCGLTIIIKFCVTLNNAWHIAKLM